MTVAAAFLAANSAFAFQTVAPANNKIGFEWMTEVTKLESQKDAETKNLMISPLSAHLALSMALNGAAGETLKDFKGYMGLKDSVSVGTINSENKELIGALVVAPLSAEEKKALPGWQPAPVGLAINNSAWYTNGATDGRVYRFRSEFVSALREGYGVREAESMDFRDPKAADTINEWVNESTYGMIPTIIDADGLKELLWVLINTVYFEGAWQTPFDLDRSTPDQTFTLLNGDKATAEFIRVKESFQYYTDGKIEVVELPFYKGDISAFVVLPKNNTQFKALQKSGLWNVQTWAKVTEGLEYKYGSIRMPKFAFDFGVELKSREPITEALGLQFLFENTANLTAMDAEGSVPSKVGLIKQNTRIEWDEKGVKAAAATLVGGMEKTSIGPDVEEFKIDADRPFFFAIYDKNTKAFLFLGQVLKP